MDDYSILGTLMDLARSLDIDVRLAPPSAMEDLCSGDHSGGAMVKLRGKDILFLDSRQFGR